jgi:hypothetical protein
MNRTFERGALAAVSLPAPESDAAQAETDGLPRLISGASDPGTFRRQFQLDGFAFRSSAIPGQLLRSLLR